MTGASIWGCKLNSLNGASYVGASQVVDQNTLLTYTPCQVIVQNILLLHALSSGNTKHFICKRLAKFQYKLLTIMLSSCQIHVLINEIHELSLI